MYERFNTNFQTISPQQGSSMTPYPQQYFDQYNQNNQMPYTDSMYPTMPMDPNQNNAYPSQMPFPPSNLANQISPNLANQTSPSGTGNNYYAKGGMVKSRNNLPSLAEMIRQQGEGGDKILAHINPEEAQMLAELSGGDINPNTGLPQFGFFSNPLKWLKGSLGGGMGAIIGNILMPGVGGIIGGALGNAAGSALRGRKDYMQAGLRGAGMGMALPTLAGFGGSIAGGLGAKGLGSYLTNYGNTNAIMPALGRLIGNNSVGNYVGSIGQGGGVLGNAISGGGNTASAGIGPVGATGEIEKSFLDTLMGKSKNFLSDPQNLLTTGVLASSFFNRPKEKSPEQLANELKRYNKAMLLSPEERAHKEAHDTAEQQSLRRIKRNRFLPEERFDIKPVHRQTYTPKEYNETGRWFDYYNDPEFREGPIQYKKGGSIPHIEYEGAKIEYPKGLGYFIKGETGGQDDKINAMLSDGEYVIPADVVSHAGDGNNNAGAKKFDILLKNIRKHKGGDIKLPPKAKSLASYMR